MGVDVNLHLNPEFDVSNVTDYLKHIGCTDVSVKSNYEIDPTYFNIFFTLNEEKRMMHFHHGLGIFNSHKISMGASGCAWEVIDQLAGAFGGIAVPNDCEDGNASVYTDCGSEFSKGSAIFILKWGLSKGIIHGSSVDDLIKAKEAFDKSMGRN